MKYYFSRRERNKYLKKKNFSGMGPKSPYWRDILQFTFSFIQLYIPYGRILEGSIIFFRDLVSKMEVRSPFLQIQN